ncbi:hypothetical protein BN946_scf184748.g16 [Trametes cinnabarina]|uniref:Uncharacterized protein n=1 Tax=Pycnoporus cinnabarinus TaxID=5643 RepID=A0A060SEA4_PYCCI|nr:hypothetical protein BN946_scf184748.g16 [Trametes cinnabarina]
MWQWYSPRISSADSLDSTDSEGGWDSWTESESSDSYDDDSDDSAEGDAPKHTQSLQLPAQALGRKGASEPIRRPSARTLSSDEFPIRRPATRRAQLPPVPSSPTTSSSDETPVTPEAHAQDPGPTIVSSGTIEPLVLEGPVLCHGKASDRGNKAVGVRTLSEVVRNLVSSQRT